MFSTMAGRVSLSDLVNNTIEGARTKLAASEGKDEKKDEKVKKLVSYEKKEHGHIPSPKEEEAEKKASTETNIDLDEVEKLASALDQVGQQLIELDKEAGDKQDHGGEYKGGGESLPVMAPVGGKQNYGKDSSKSHNVPMSTESQKGDGGNPAKTQVKNDHAKAPGGAPYPKKGVMKTAGTSVLDRIRAAAAPKTDESEAGEGEEKVAEFPPSKDEGKEDKGEKKAPVMLFGKKKDEDKKGEEKKDDKEKKASNVDHILNKIANVEKRMGGETLDSKSGEGVKVPSGGTNGARSMIASNEAATNAKKVQAKAPQKKLMSEVLTEPMQSKAHDHKVSDNLRNASKGGVKIAAVREALKKIAAEGCTCEGKGECKNCKMKKAMEKKSMGGMPSTGPASGASSSMPAGPTM